MFLIISVMPSLFQSPEITNPNILPLLHWVSILRLPSPLLQWHQQLLYWSQTCSCGHRKAFFQSAGNKDRIQIQTHLNAAGEAYQYVEHWYQIYRYLMINPGCHTEVARWRIASSVVANVANDWPWFFNIGWPCATGFAWKVVPPKESVAINRGGTLEIESTTDNRLYNIINYKDNVAFYTCYTTCGCNIDPSSFMWM